MGRKAKSPRRFAWATALGVLLAIGLVGGALRYGLDQRQRSESTRGRTEVRTWYPEPEVLLGWEPDLKLTERQHRQIEVANRQWQLKRAAYDAQMRTYGSSAGQALADLAAGKERKGRYGQLLHDFDQARDAAWKNATGYLEPKQVLMLETLRKNGPKPKK